MAGSDDVIHMAKELAGAVSTQAQVANRIWLGLTTVAIVALLPRSAAAAGSTEVGLPFGLGQVEASSFYLILFFLLAALTIAFSAAHAQQVRAQKLTQLFLDEKASPPTGPADIHLRELFDLLRLPSFNRVAPLAQLIRGRYQFYGSAAGCPAWLRFVSTVFYIMLRLVAMAVYFGLPAWALALAFQRARAGGSWQWAVVVAGTLALAALLELTVAEFIYFGKTVPQIWSGGARSSKTGRLL